VGEDRFTGRNFDHRKQWLVERLATLGELFAIDICAYAVMSNHYHLVARIAPQQAEAWGRDEVLARWSKLFSLPTIANRYLRGERLLEVEWDRLDQWVAQWKARLCDLSWFMRCLNEPIARKANAEDGCTGRFWEGRFKSQALLDDAALLTCMAYVDLNPIRAGLAETPEVSDYTAIQQRIREWQAIQKNSTPSEACGSEVSDRSNPSPPPKSPRLLEFSGPDHRHASDGLPFDLPDYLELVDWTGRAVREGKRGLIPPDVPPILDRLAIDPKAWLRHCRVRRLPFQDAVGPASALRRAAEILGRKFLKGLSPAKILFPEPA
jgi:REP element-mobilizing transposase RayT